MKRIAYYFTLSLIILLLLVGCDEARTKTSPDTVVSTQVAAIPEITAEPTSSNYDTVIPTPTTTPPNDDTDAVIPTPTPRVFDVDDVNMQSTPKSSCFSEIGYDSDWEVLVVRFRDSGSVYTYSGFPEEEWSKFTEAKSLGSWYNKHIKGRYEDEKIDE